MTGIQSGIETGLEHPQAIRAVFFDAGYTLLAPHPSIGDIVLATCVDRGLAVDAERIAAQMPLAERVLRRRASEQPWTWSDEVAIRKVWTEYYKVLLQPYLRELSADEAAACVSDVVQAFEGAASYALYPDVVPVLEALRARGLTLGIISDWGIGLGLILRHHDLVQYFDFAVISAAVRLAKPDPALFETALRRANTIPDYALHVGDAYLLDVLGARAAGITPVLLDRNHRHGKGDLDCLVVPDLYGVLDLLDVPRPATSGPQDSQRLPGS